MCLGRYLSERSRIPIISTATELMRCPVSQLLSLGRDYSWTGQEVVGLSELTQVYPTSWVIIAWIQLNAGFKFSYKTLI